MTPPFTPEQISELRLPAGFSIYQDEDYPRAPWEVAYESDDPARQDYAIGEIALMVANGYLPPAILTAAWSILDGTAEWRSHNGDDFEEHETERAAKQDALDSISDARDEREWPDWIDWVEYGLWIPFAKATRCDESEGSDGEDQCDYRLEKVGKNVQATKKTAPKA
jgi:hypothetical protein